MNIAFIVEAFPCLSQTFILDQITGLIDLGHEVEIFAGRDPQEKKIHASFNEYRLREKVHYPNKTLQSRIPRLGKAIYLIIKNLPRHPGLVLQALGQFKHCRDMNLLQFLELVLPFFDCSFDIIHCHFGPMGLRGLALKKIGIPAKLITTFHGYDIHCYPRRVGQDVYRRLFDDGDLFTANSNFTKNRVAALGCQEEKIRILPVGLKIEQFSFRERKILPNELVRICTVARFVEKKGHRFALEALAKVVKKHPNVIYSLAGGGRLENDMKALAAELQIEDKVEFLGELTQQEIVELYQRSHFFVLPSITASDGDMEGQGLVLQEAQACGMPVISTLHNGIPEGIQDGLSGFLVPEKDVDGLAEKMEYLIEHPEIWAEMGSCGRKFVEEKYDIKGLNHRLENIYKDLLSNHRG